MTEENDIEWALLAYNTYFKANEQQENVNYILTCKLWPLNKK